MWTLCENEFPSLTKLNEWFQSRGEMKMGDVLSVTKYEALRALYPEQPWNRYLHGGYRVIYWEKP
jgi:hypothetical protein